MGDTKYATSLEKRILKHYNNLSKSYRILARYIIENPEDLALLTAAKLAEKVGVSESLVIKFASRIGYSGYPELQLMAQDIVRAELSPVERFDEKVGELDKGHLYSTFKIDQENLQATYKGISPELIQSISEMISNAKKIFIIGMRESSALAELLGIFLDYILDNVFVLTHSGSELFQPLRRLEKEDVVIGFSFARYTLKTIEALEYAKNIGAKIIVFTDSLLSPVVEFTDYKLIVKTNSPTFLNSYTACIFLINALMMEIISSNPERFKKELIDLEEVLKPFKLWKENRFQKKKAGN